MTAGWKRICCCSFVPLFSPSNYLLGRAQDTEKGKKKREKAKVIAPKDPMNGTVITFVCAEHFSLKRAVWKKAAFTCKYRGI